MGVLIIPLIIFIPTLVSFPLGIYFFWHHNLVALAITVIAGTIVQAVWWKLVAALFNQSLHIQ